MRLKRIFLAIIILFVVAIGGYTSGKYFFKDKPAIAVTSPVKGYKVKISNEDWGKIKQIETEFGYKRSYYADYNPYKDQHFLEESNKNKNLFASLLNKSDRALREKSLIVRVGDITLLGYDKSGIVNNATYDQVNKILYVQPPRLQMIAMIDFKDTAKLGFLPKLFSNFTPEQIDAFHNGAKMMVEEKFESKKEIQAGYNYTNRIVKSEIMNMKFSFSVKDVKFKQNDQMPEILNNEIKFK